jgi:hypothetical protein
MQPFNRHHEIGAIYRVTVPLPVSVQWPSGQQTLEVRANNYPPYGISELVGPGLRRSTPRHFACLEHAIHTYAHGVLVTVPSVESTFFEKLVRLGLAELVAGPHLGLYAPDYRPAALWPELNAYYTFPRR